MNADCTYVYNPTQDLTLYKDPTSSWLLNFDVDTTVKLWGQQIYFYTIESFKRIEFFQKSRFDTKKKLLKSSFFDALKRQPIVPMITLF